jgi:hypothetical protein
MAPVTTSLVALGALLLVWVFVAHCVQRRNKDNKTAELWLCINNIATQLEQHVCEHNDYLYVGKRGGVLAYKKTGEVSLKVVEITPDINYPGYFVLHGPLKICKNCRYYEAISLAEYREQYARQMADKAARLAEEAEELLTTGGE